MSTTPTSNTTLLPSWFRQEIPDMENIRRMKTQFRAAGLHTVCESARCPNLGQCWGQGVATFMILGDICTRACRFCSVVAGRPLAVDAGEPQEVALAVQRLQLRYVVITSVARDDLPDEGAAHFAHTIAAIRQRCPSTKIEVLIPDFSNKAASIQQLVNAAPEVVSHNIETVQRLSVAVRPQADYQRSLEVLAHFKQFNPKQLIKSSFMVGLGENDQDIKALMQDLVATGCELLTIGQYLAPTRLKRHVPVQRYVAPEEFEQYKAWGLAFGFKHVMSAPLVRSSFIAEQGYRECFKAMEGHDA